MQEFRAGRGSLEDADRPPGYPLESNQGVLREGTGAGSADANPGQRRLPVFLPDSRRRRRLDDVHGLHEPAHRERESQWHDRSRRAVGLWNEADYRGFWKGTQAQWLETWKYAYSRFRAHPRRLIEGPSFATGAGGSWMNAFLDYAKTNNVIPDYISWHEAGGGAIQWATWRDQSRAFEPRDHGRERFRPQRIWVDERAEPGPLRLVPREIRSGGHPGSAQQLGRRLAVLSNMGDLVAANWQPNSQYWI